MDQQVNSIPYIAFESELARQERHIKRLWSALIAAIICIVITAGAFLLYLNQYDFVAYDQDGEGVNIIGDANGVDFNGATLSGTD